MSPARDVAFLDFCSKGLISPNYAIATSKGYSKTFE
jgi:hypothetical protein